MIVYREMLPDGGYVEHMSLEIIPQEANYVEVDKTKTFEEITEQKKIQIQEYKIQQHKELSITDWCYTRFLETGQEVPLEIKQERQEIRNKYNNLIQQITNE